MKKVDPIPTNTNVNTNNNVNNNHVNVKVHVTQSKVGRSSSKKNGPNWAKRIIIGGIITTLLSVGGYYLKKKIDAKNGVSDAILQTK